MQRRTFLQSALWSPFLAIPAASTTVAAVASPYPQIAGTLTTGLSPLDALLGGIVPGTFRWGVSGVNGPPRSGITLGLLKLAARICQRYTTTVLFYDLTGCVIDVRQRLAGRQAEVTGRSEELESPIKVDDRSCRRPRLHLIDSAAIEGETAYDLAVRLGRGSIQGYALLILDGWRTYIDHGFPVRPLGNGALAPGELIAESTLSVQQLITIQLRAAGDDLPLLIGVSTATNDPISPATLAVDAALRDFPDRQVRLCRSQLFLGTDEWKRHPPHVATLTGDNPGAPNFRPAFQRKP